MDKQSFIAWINTPAGGEMPTFEELYAFMLKEYRRERFEGRNTSWPKCEEDRKDDHGNVLCAKGDPYSKYLTASYYQALLKDGHCLISQHDSQSGRPVFFNRDLRKIED